MSMEHSYRSGESFLTIFCLCMQKKIRRIQSKKTQLFLINLKWCPDHCSLQVRDRLSINFTPYIQLGEGILDSQFWSPTIGIPWALLRVQIENRRCGIKLFDNVSDSLLRCNCGLREFDRKISSNIKKSNIPSPS